MYKLNYYQSEGSSHVSIKEFHSLDEAFDFLFKMPSGTLIELKYYDDVDNRKPDRN